MFTNETRWVFLSCKQNKKSKIALESKRKRSFVIMKPLTLTQFTSYDHSGCSLSGANVVCGHTFVCSTVALFNFGYQELSVICELCCGGQAGPAHPTPCELNGMSAVGKALQLQCISGLEPHLIG